MAITIKRAKGKVAARGRRHLRVRKKVAGTAARPRLVVSRSSRHVFVQIVDDTVGKTLVSASTMEADLRSFEGDELGTTRIIVLGDDDLVETMSNVGARIGLQGAQQIGT